MSILTISPSSPAILGASQTIWALLLERVSGEKRLLPSAIGLYSNALRRAQQEVNDPQTDKCTIIGTAHLLSVCELFQRVSLDDAGTTRPHARWLVSFMERHRDDIGNEGMQRFRRSNVRLVAAWEILITRRSYANTTLLLETDLCDGTITTLSDLTLLTASLLEESDNLCRADYAPYPSSIFDMLERIVFLERMLHDWMSKYIKTSPSSPYRLVEPKSLPYTTGRGTRSLFRSVYVFRDLQTQVLYISYWLCQLLLVDARLNIASAHECKFDADVNETMRLKVLAKEYADHSSKSMPTMGAPYAAWAGRIMAVRPLHLLLLYYKQHRDWQKLSWCVECARDIGILVDRVAKFGPGCAAQACRTTTSTQSTTADVEASSI